MLSYEWDDTREIRLKALKLLREVSSGKRKIAHGGPFGRENYLRLLRPLLILAELLEGQNQDQKKAEPSHLTALLLKVFRDFCQSHLHLNRGIHQTYHFDFSLLEASARPGHPAFAPPCSL